MRRGHAVCAQRYLAKGSAMMPPKPASAFRRLGASLSPLALCLLVGWLLTKGSLSLGGGEKDILLVFPLAVWSLVFALSSLTLWARGASLAKSSLVSALVASGALAAAFAALVVVSLR